MSWRHGVAVGLSAFAWAGCGDASDSGSPPTTVVEVPAGTPEGLTVTCGADTTEVDATAVAAGPSGLAVEVVDATSRGLNVFLQATDESEGAYVEATGGLVELHPGPYLVRCVDMDEPEHMEPAGESDESKRIELFAEPSAWIPEHELACDRRSTSVRDYVDPGEPAADPSAHPVEPVVRDDPEVGGWLRDDDELVVTGYREAAGRRVEVVRGDAVMGVVRLALGPQGWFVTGTEVCADAH